MALLIGALTLGSLAALAAYALGRQGTGMSAGAGLGPADWAALRFTLWQSFLSASLSLALAVPLARALARRRFRGRGLLLSLLGAPFLLPVIVAVLGLLAIYGRSGLLSQGLMALGGPRLSVYGLGGVVLAHLFLNLPLATRMLLQGWAAIPGESFRLAASLGFRPADIRRHLEYPMLRAHAPGAWIAVFTVCLTSFTVALILGGGPRATTVELAIYQALRFDFAPGRAALLAGMQFGLCALAALAAGIWARPARFGAGLMQAPTPPRHDAGGLGLRLLDGGLIALAVLFLLSPMLLLAWRGLPALPGLPPSVWAAAGRSVAVALVSCLLCLALCLPLAEAALRLRRGRWLELAGMLGLAASPLVMGAGLFLALRGIASPASIALPVTVLVNAITALPFALRLLLPALAVLHHDHDRLAQSLGLQGLARLRLLTLPRLAPPLGFAAGLAAALSMGDLGVIALFGDETVATLPLQLYRLMGAYRMEAAAGAALLLTLISFALFWALDAGGRAYAAPGRSAT